MMTKVKIVFLILIFMITGCTQDKPLDKQWQFNNLAKIGGFNVLIEGEPEVIEENKDKVISFDGTKDRIHLAGNILQGTPSFTLELIVKPLAPTTEGKEPRIVHIEDPNNSEHRLTLEMRFNDKNEWYLDAFLKDGDSALALIDSSYTYPINKWANIAMTFNNGQLSSYVNGKKLLTAPVSFSPLPTSANTSIGARMNQVNYFHGMVSVLKATGKVLSANEMMVINE